MKNILIIVFGLLIGITSNAQSLNVVKGKVIDANTNKPITGVNVLIQGTDVTQQTAGDGIFKLQNVPNGEQILELKK